MRSHDTKINLGRRGVETIKFAYDKKYRNVVWRNITKVKSGDNGFERYYAIIDKKRVEVFLNENGKTGAAFRVSVDEAVKEKLNSVQSVSIADCVGMQIPTIDLGDDVDGDCEAPENEFFESADNTQWFLNRAVEFEFHPILRRCHMCHMVADYNGITQAVNYDDDRVINGTIFQFCKSCRDRLVQHAICQKIAS